MARVVYVNGEYVAEEAARVSIFDRGYLFGDGIYEVIPVLRGGLVDKAYFFERLDRSLSEIGIDWPCSREDYLGVMRGLIERNGLEEGVIYSQVTRGVAPRDFSFPADTAPGFVAFSTPMNLLQHPAASSGVEVVTTPDLRWKRRDVKSINLLGQVLAKQDARERDAFEGWMVEDGMVTEGVSSSAYLVRDGRLITRPLSRDILPGIRRRTLLELAGEADIALEERPFSVEEALAADEAMISSATTMALGVVAIDGHRIGDGRPGPVTLKLRELYIKRALAEAEAG